MLRLRIIAAAVSCSILLTATLSLAQTASVAIVAAASNAGLSSPRFTDLQDVLMADGRFGTVDLYSTTSFGSGTPSFNELMQYDAVIHWTNDSNANSSSLGNVLADYVDAGRGVVQALFSNTSDNPDRYLRGRWMSGGYNILLPLGGTVQGPTPGLGEQSETANMAPPLEPDHPIFMGVEEVRLSTGEFSLGGLFGAWRPATPIVLPGSRKLAVWDDGTTAVAVSDVYPNRVDLGFHPVSDAVNDGYYDSTSDASRLIANALLFSAGKLVTLTGDFNGDGALNCTDIDMLVSAIASGQHDPIFDLGGDGQVDLQDRDAWLVSAGSVNLPSGKPYLLGDADLSGTVDGADFVIFNENKFTSQAAWCKGDFNADGFIDGSDFVFWNENKFDTSEIASSGTPNAVPEPNGAVFLILSGLIILAAGSRLKY